MANHGELELDFEIYFLYDFTQHFFCENEGPLDYFNNFQTNLLYIW